jgi:UTP--glucose-1-phosphate uridylyltransferase
VLQARDIVGNHPFLLMLGDHLYKSTTTTKNCIAQLLGAFDGTTSIIGACISDEDVVSSVAVLTGSFTTPTSLAVHEIVEKPTVEYARGSLATTGVPDGKYLTAFGLYVLKPDIFGMLQDSVAANVRFAGQIGLTQCLDRMRKECGLNAFVISGSRFDIGLDAPSYLQALTQYGGK